jgi:hypothetical protein
MKGKPNFAIGLTLFALFFFITVVSTYWAIVSMLNGNLWGIAWALSAFLFLLVSENSWNKLGS